MQTLRKLHPFGRFSSEWFACPLNGGKLSAIGKAHRMTYAGVLKRVKEDPELTATLHESRESLVNEAQTKLGEAVREGSAWAVKFVLETWGKSRGFTKQLEVAEQSTTKLQVVIYLPDNGRGRAIS